MYAFIIINENGFVHQITSTSNKSLPILPHGLVAKHIEFFNGDLAGCYYADGVFYEDEERTVVISNPVTYQKPEPMPEPEEARYTLDEVAEIILNEVSEVSY